MLEIKGNELKNKKHVAQWRSTLETYAYPVIGDKAVSEITKMDLLAILEPIWLTKNETASRVRGRIETVMDYAKAKEYFEGDNPAAWKGVLKPLLPMPSKVQTKNIMRHCLTKMQAHLWQNCVNGPGFQPEHWSFPY